MDCNQINIFINIEIIGEEDKTKKNYKIIMIWQVLKRSTKSQRFRLYIYIYIYILVFSNIEEDRV